MRWFLVCLAFAIAGSAHAQQGPTLFTRMTDTPLATFTLKDQNGREFTPEQLRGKVWIAHFFFTTCTQGCDKTVARMKDIQDAIRGKNDLALVSISVNPDIDTPELLTEFAKDLSAEPKQWTFLTGSKGAVDAVVEKSFFQSSAFNATAPKDQQITHGWNLVIVDREGRLAGYVDGRDPTNVGPLLERVRALASERYTLPAVNATLNGTAGFLLLVGYFAIRRRKIGLHKTCMLLAFGCSAVFLASYLYYHFAVLKGAATTFVGPPTVRTIYLAVLLSHTLLAVAVAPMAIFTTVQGLKNNLAKHVKIARWTLPIWLYVSVTGVFVYVMLYHLYPPY